MPPEQKIISIIADKHGRESSSIKLSDKFREDLSFDSLDQVELCMEIEDAFFLKFTDSEMEAISTVQDAVNLVVLKLPQ